jgi:HSP20 family protein
MTLTRWSPLRDLAAVEVDVLHQMFNSAFGNGDEAVTRGAWVPAVDIYETAEKDVVLKVDLPDVKRENIKVTFENNVLSIEGDRQLASNVAEDRFHRFERGHGSFRRSFTLPTTVDATRVDAKYEDGVLTVKLPRREESRPRTIEIS